MAQGSNLTQFFQSQEKVKKWPWYALNPQSLHHLMTYWLILLIDYRWHKHYCCNCMVLPHIPNGMKTSALQKRPLWKKGNFQLCPQVGGMKERDSQAVIPYMVLNRCSVWDTLTSYFNRIERKISFHWVFLEGNSSLSVWEYGRKKVVQGLFMSSEGPVWAERASLLKAKGLRLKVTLQVNSQTELFGVRVVVGNVGNRFWLYLFFFV